MASLRPAWLSSATGRCDLAQQQEYLDRGVNDYVSTYNPDYAGGVDDTLVAVRTPPLAARGHRHAPRRAYIPCAVLRTKRAGARGSGLAVDVILTPPHIFCMQNHY